MESNTNDKRQEVSWILAKIDSVQRSLDNASTVILATYGAIELCESKYDTVSIDEWKDLWIRDEDTLSEEHKMLKSFINKSHDIINRNMRAYSKSHGEQFNYLTGYAKIYPNEAYALMKKVVDKERNMLKGRYEEVINLVRSMKDLTNNE